jgi:hypothetical protein
LPDVDRAAEATADAVVESRINEDGVMIIARYWSMNPQPLEDAPAPGDALAARRQLDQLLS